MSMSVWHYAIDTLPHAESPNQVDGSRSSTPPRNLVVRIPFGVWADRLPLVTSDGERVVDIVLDLDVGGERYPIRLGQRSAKGFIRAITRELIAFERVADPLGARWYLDMDRELVEHPQNRYFEVVVTQVPTGSSVRYRATITPTPTGPIANEHKQTLGRYRFEAVAPPALSDRNRWSAFYANDGSGGIEPACVLLYSSDSTHHYVRADFADISQSRPRFELEVAGFEWPALDAANLDLAALPSLPLIDPFKDTVVAAIRKTDVPTVSSVTWHGQVRPVDAKTNVGRARLMFIHYCMQGLNDLFEKPNTGYEPPRTYMQTTMRDEAHTYSSRPQSVDRTVGDGYVYTLESHKRYHLPYLWTFNGGVLALMAHDLMPEDWAAIRDAIADNSLRPTLAGCGGHRLPYYDEQTNFDSIGLGRTMMRNILGEFNDVYYLDQRLYEQTPNVFRALERQRVKYIVVDGETGFYPYQNTRILNRGNGHEYLDDQYLWRDASTGLFLLFINSEIRNKMVQATDYERARGKLNRDLRNKFLYFASNPEVRQRNLLIYSDDADKASGNGWFDGDYDGGEVPYPENYAAALEWISAHPWIEVVTTDDLSPEDDCVGTIDMQTAIDPTLDPGGITTPDAYGELLHFDTWYKNWSGFEARWLGKTLEQLSKAAEFAIIDWPEDCRNHLYELAKICFSMAQHESQWNKQPLEPIDGKDPNNRRDVIEPEDFVIAAALQVRNTHVYLAASMWAQWAESPSSSACDTTYVNDGPLVERLGAVRYTRTSGRSHEFVVKPIFPDPLCIDQDPLQNVLIYNRKVLVVIDRNGGRVTHLFAWRPDLGPVCLSGTPKAWQFLTEDPQSRGSFVCDGEVLQNTVYTPNHAFIACDVKQATGTQGKKFNPKSSLKDGEHDLDAWYPDNFNAYDVRTDGAGAVLTYRQTMRSVPMDLATFRTLLDIDRSSLIQGHPGVVFHPDPSFSKRISLRDRRITVEYTGVQEGHIVANELCGDVYRAILHGWRNRRSDRGRSITIKSETGAGATLTLGSNCAFTSDTLEREGNLRLHRVLTDCIEVEATTAGAFSYQIDVIGPAGDDSNH